jgi:glycosyltransferase involved in cell wall biosynthesis
VKKVLILTYYWPPSGGAGVQRWLKFVKYLREFGWEPIVYTAENGEYPVLDESLFKDIPQGITILKQPIWEPYQLYKKVIGQKKDERVVSGFLKEKGKISWGHKLSLWLRGNVFIPDARRFWIRPSTNYLSRWLKENPVDVIVSTGPPHSMHLIGMNLHKETGIPWLADFRDPWVNIDFAGDLKMSSWAKNRNISLEKKVLESANLIVVVSELMAEEFRSKTNKPVEIITNGFDPDDFIVDESLIRKDGKFSIVHTGSLNDRRNHPALWKSIAKLREDNAEFKALCEIRLIGKNDVSVRESIQNEGLNDCTVWIDYLPHEQIMVEQKSASVLLLSINNYGAAEDQFFSSKATLTGKLFEYLAAERPILMIGPDDGQAAEVVRKSSAGFVSDFTDSANMMSILKTVFENRDKVQIKQDGGSLEQYSRKKLTENLSKQLNLLIRN